MQIKGGELLSINISFGSSVLTIADGKVNKSLVLYPKPNFPFYDKKLLRLLASGSITQIEHDQRKAFDSDIATIYIIEESTIENSTLVAYAESLGYDSVGGDTLLDTVTNINALGLQIII